MKGTRIERQRLASRVVLALRRSRVVALTGPRQCGKTTLARSLATAGRGAYFDLEDPVAAAMLAEPLTALGPLRGLVVIDEVQRAPQLFPVLRVLADRDPGPARFLLLGSASPELTRQASESLAGRVEFVDMAGFTLEEVGKGALRRLWQRGGFPRAFLARGEAASLAWREDFIRTFLERDVRNLGINIPAPALRRLWTMLAHYHGQIWNASEIGRALGEAHTTVKRHADSLAGALVVRQLQPWFENLGKRQIKAPKVYVRDSGLLHALLGIGSGAALAQHPKAGASWEGFVIEQALAAAGERNAYYWGTQSGAELDLLLLRGGKRYGVEVKHADAPRLTKSMAIAQHDLRLERLFVVYPGSETYALGAHAVALGLPELLRRLR
ncbi:MAG: ATP-binding protein [Burkholderiales bacterium]